MVYICIICRFLLHIYYKLLQTLYIREMVETEQTSIRSQLCPDWPYFVHIFMCLQCTLYPFPSPQHNQSSFNSNQVLTTTVKLNFVSPFSLEIEILYF